MPRGSAEMSELETTRIIVRVEQGKASHAEFSFADRFSIGRDSGCDVQIMDDASVSRTHVEISFYDGSWRLRDAGSTNGTYVDGKKIDVFTLGASVKLRVGTGKTILSLIPQTGQTAAVEGESNSLTQYVQHYFGASNVEPAASIP
jgi:pSer/pThr/pTyr-binding forkhead associated (FHA) protein